MEGKDSRRQSRNNDSSRLSEGSKTHNDSLSSRHRRNEFILGSSQSKNSSQSAKSDQITDKQV